MLLKRRPQVVGAGRVDRGLTSAAWVFLRRLSVPSSPASLRPSSTMVDCSGTAPAYAKVVSENSVGLVIARIVEAGNTE